MDEAGEGSAYDGIKVNKIARAKRPTLLHVVKSMRIKGAISKQ